MEDIDKAMDKWKMEIKLEFVSGQNPKEESPGARKAIAVAISKEYIYNLSQF